MVIRFISFYVFLPTEFLNTALFLKKLSTSSLLTTLIQRGNQFILGLGSIQREVDNNKACTIVIKIICVMVPFNPTTLDRGIPHP